MNRSHGEDLLPISDAVNPDLPWLWLARAGDSKLAGMSAPPPGFPFEFLRDRGFDTIVSLAGPVSYDPSPLTACAYDLQDLVGGLSPDDPEAEAAKVESAVTTTSELLADGRSVAVHCRMGVGRTGLVIGAVMVDAGHDPDEVAAWLAAVQQARGVKGWPESPWQRSALDAYTEVFSPGLTV